MSSSSSNFSNSSSNSVSPQTSESSQELQTDLSIVQMLKELDIPINRNVRKDSIFEEKPLSTNSQGPQRLITESFLRGRSQWIDEPIINSWRQPSDALLSIFAEADELYSQWQKRRPAPFDPFFDALWLDTAKTMHDGGLLWHNNNVNMPDEIDTSWPFTLKNFERAVISAKGRKLSHPDAAGYVIDWSEGNCYGIRTLNEELQKQFPQSRPVFLTDQLEIEQADTAARLFGLDWHKVQLEDSNDFYGQINELTSSGTRPILFAATLASSQADSDDMTIIDKLSQRFPLILHLDAGRVFDFLTTADEDHREKLQIPQLRLCHPQFGLPRCFEHGTIFASTIVAGGSNAHVTPPPVAVLKPRLLGTETNTSVEYVRGKDRTLSGSRDAIGPLMLCLQELRWGDNGFREIYETCIVRREKLINELRKAGITTQANSLSFDLKICLKDPSMAQSLTNLGMKALGHNSYMLTVQPSVSLQDIMSLLHIFNVQTRDTTTYVETQPDLTTLRQRYCLPDGVKEKIWSTVQGFKVDARFSCGYPVNQALYSALGPAIGPFLTLRIPESWAIERAAEIFDRRKQTFGLFTPETQRSFRASFTTGSTMGNRIGLFTALNEMPNAYVYFSSESHYSVKKIVRDCDSLGNKWRPGRTPRFFEIQADKSGGMDPKALAEQVVLNRKNCASHKENHQVIILANLGTTFIGGRDNLAAIQQELAKIGSEPPYIHIDGALDLGFTTEGITLGPPGSPCHADRPPVVQGITLSHHKVFGIMVSGEVICYCSDASREFGATTKTVDPRAIFETWLSQQLYHEKDLVTIREYCQAHSDLLRKLLHDMGLPTWYNESTIITLLERPPPWVIEEFQLAPEGDWVHFITMPHVSPTIVRHFIRTLELIDIHCSTVFDYVKSSLATTLPQGVTLKRLTCRSPYATTVERMAKAPSFPKSQTHQPMPDNLKKSQESSLGSEFIRDAISFIAVDDKDEVLVVFVAEADRQRHVQPNIILVHPSCDADIHMLRDVGMQLYGCIARLLNVTLKTHDSSYQVVSLTGF